MVLDGNGVQHAPRKKQSPGEPGLQINRLCDQIGR